MQPRSRDIGPLKNVARPDGSRPHQIVNTAADLFDRYGYHQTSMSALADSVGISKATLYHYFDSKAAILFWIHEEFIDLLIDRHRRRTKSTDDSAELLLGVMSDILELMHTHRGHIRVFFEHWRELPDEESRLMGVKRRSYFEAVRQLVATGRERGEFDTPEPELTTLALFGMCNWAYQWYRPDGPVRPEAIAQHFWNVLIHGAATDVPRARWTVPTFNS